MSADAAAQGSRMGRVIALTIIGVLVLAGAVALFLLWPRGAASPEEALSTFIDAWERGDWEALEASTLEPGAAEAHAQAHDALDVTETDLTVLGLEETRSEATARLDVTLAIEGFGAWSYQTSVSMRTEDSEWRIDWSPATLHPALEEGLRFRRTIEWEPRAHILGHDDASLTFDGTVVAVGIEPQRMDDRRATLAAIEEHLGIPPERVVQELDRPGVQPHWFVPVTELREETFEELRDDLAPIPGVVFRRDPARLILYEGFAPHLMGRVGEITAERLEELGPPYTVGDEVGLSGLERVFEGQLAGTPSAEIQLVDEDGDVAETLHRFEGDAPEPVRTTIDPALQQAAEETLADVTEPAALVAIDAPTGEVRAVVSLPVSEFNRALGGQYPPGSAFKIVTAAALLETHDATDAVPCPAEIVVGRPFRNAGGVDRGTVPFREAFVHSCNTSFAHLSRELTPDGFREQTTGFGFGADHDMPLSVAGGQFPTPEGEAEQAAAAIGQGRVLVSPVHTASVAAAVASGEWRSPILTVDGEQDTRLLDPQIASTLREWMQAVVTEGTGTAATLPGEPVAGKTGTAEFGRGAPPSTHAWFTGFRGSLAFAVLVEGAGFGGEVAAPIARDFLLAVEEQT